MVSFNVLLLFITSFTTLFGAKPPNVIVIVTDDQGNSDASYNYEIHSPGKKAPIHTPNMDYLAKRSIKFSRHYSQPMCGPTRMALLTGRYPYRLQNAFATMYPHDLHGDLMPNVPTLLEELKSIGYSTHLVGKWGIDNGFRQYNDIFHKWVPSASFDKRKNHGYGPNGRGFDTFYGFYSHFHHHFNKEIAGIPDWHKFDIDLPVSLQNDSTLDPKTNKLDREKHLSSSYVFAREAIDLIKQYKNNVRKGPYYLQISFSMPHDPLVVDKLYEEKPSCINMPNFRRKKYCGMVQCLDEAIGNITRYLESIKELDNTIIVVFSDNGGNPMVGGFNYPFRGTKSQSYEGGIRTLAFLHAPMLYPHQTNVIYPHIFHITDWVPTILGMINKVSPNTYKTKKNKFLNEVDGIDFSSSFHSLSKNRDKLIMESNGWLNRTTLFWNNYKFIYGAQAMNNWQVFYEPDSKWIYNKNNLNWGHKLGNILTSIGRFIFGDDKERTLKEAHWHVICGAIYDSINKISPALERDHYEGHNTYIQEYRDFTIPTLNFSFYFNDYIKEYYNHNEDSLLQLYDIENDPFEENNLILSPEFETKYKPLLNDIWYNYYIPKLLKDDPPPDTNAFFEVIGGEANALGDKIKIGLGVVMVIIILLISFCCIKCCNCCGLCSSKSVSKKKKNN